MKAVVVVLCLALLAIAPAGMLKAEPFCDLALESGKVTDWLICMVFAMVIDRFEGDWFGNGAAW